MSSEGIKQMATIRQAQRAINRAGIPVELVRGEGYHYFVYDNPEKGIFDTISVYVPYTNQLSVERWVEEAKDAYDTIYREWNNAFLA